jgi:hypothetical protein
VGEVECNERNYNCCNLNMSKGEKDIQLLMAVLFIRSGL